MTLTGNSDLTKVLASAGVLAGIIYAMKRKEGMGGTAIYAAVFGIGAAFIGNTITKNKVNDQ